MQLKFPEELPAINPHAAELNTLARLLIIIWKTCFPWTTSHDNFLQDFLAQNRVQTPTKASMFNAKSAARLLHLSWEQVHLAALARLQDIAGNWGCGMSQHVRFLMIFQAACALVKDVNDLRMEMQSIEAHRRAFRLTHTWLSLYAFLFLGRETRLIQCQQWILPNSLWMKGLHQSRVIQETLDSDSSEQSEDNLPWNLVMLSL